MGLFLYNIFLALFNGGIRIAAFSNTKARKWLDGRQNIMEKLESGIRGSGLTGTTSTKGKIVWMHCASLGEFEQGRPLLEKLKSRFPHYKYLLTFFSPSGYEIRKDYKGADWVYYLPMDSAANARRFLEIADPALVIFVKYEYWYYYLREIHQRKIPLLLVSALFRENDIFFRGYGSLQRKMLSFFSQLFVQNESSKNLLNSIGFGGNSIISGDTRFDRVIEIAEGSAPIAEIETFINGNKSIIAGSTWPKDEQLLRETIGAINDPSLKLILAPHEINRDHIQHLQNLFPEAILYSQLLNSPAQKSNILIIDNIGTLSRIYKFAYITYIGGGFGSGIHNTLEAAVYGKPVLFGPNHQKFNEAVELVKSGGAFCIKDTGECIAVVDRLLKNGEEYSKSCGIARAFVYSNQGASEKILHYIQENRLLTS